MKKLHLLVFGVFLITSCSKEIEYPFDQSPFVEFQEISYNEDGNTDRWVELTFIVWDREGDIGYGESEVGFPYNQYNIIIDSNDELVKVSNEVEPPFYQTAMDILFNPEAGRDDYYITSNEKTLFSEIDGRNGDFSCEEYFIRFDLSSSYGDILDTLYGQENEFYKNLDIGIYLENGEKFNFQEYFGSNDCMIGDFSSRLFDISGVGRINPVDSYQFKIEKRGKYAWKVTYLMKSLAWGLMFRDKSLEIRFSINDRALNESNIATSGLVTLEEITVE